MTPSSARRFVLVSLFVTMLVTGLARTLDRRQIPRARGFVAALIVAVFL